jgi:hypothetical protein
MLENPTSGALPPAWAAAARGKIDARTTAEVSIARRIDA